LIKGGYELKPFKFISFLIELNKFAIGLVKDKQREIKELNDVYHLQRELMGKNKVGKYLLNDTIDKQSKIYGEMLKRFADIIRKYFF